jgi:hypothetical protein
MDGAFYQIGIGFFPRHLIPSTRSNGNALLS